MKYSKNKCLTQLVYTCTFQTYLLINLVHRYVVLCCHVRVRTMFGSSLSHCLQGHMFYLLVCICVYCCPTPFPSQIMLVSFNGKNTGATSGAGIVYPSGVHGFSLVFFLPGFELLNLNFVDHCLSFFLQPLHCLCFYKLRSLFIPLVSLNQQPLVSFPYLLHNLINVIKGSTSIYKSEINLNASP